MKRFLSVLGGMLTVTAFSAATLAIAKFPYACGMILVAAFALAIAGVLFYLGYSFTREVILGGR